LTAVAEQATQTSEGVMTMENKHIGGNFDDFLAVEALLEDATGPGSVGYLIPAYRASETATHPDTTFLRIWEHF
jgi:hypothetical protein